MFRLLRCGLDVPFVGDGGLPFCLAFQIRDEFNR